MRTLLRSAAVIALAGALGGCHASGPTGAPEGGVTHEVRVAAPGGAVVLSPATVQAGPVSFRVDGEGDHTGHANWEFVSHVEPGCTQCSPMPLTEADIALLRTDSAPPGFAYDTGWGAGIELTLAPGLYAFIVPGPNGTVPGEPPSSLTVLTVQP